MCHEQGTAESFAPDVIHRQLLVKLLVFLRALLAMQEILRALLLALPISDMWYEVCGEESLLFWSLVP